jgi:hypothetical protein
MYLLFVQLQSNLNHQTFIKCQLEIQNAESFPSSQ